MSKGPTPSRSVKELDWVGWDRMKELLNKAQRTEFKFGNQAKKQRMARGLILVGFKTGGRIKEVLSLDKMNFSFEGEFWTVNMPLVKRWHSTDEEVQKWKCKKCNRRWEKKPTTIINRTAEELLLKCSGGGYHNVKEYTGYNAVKEEASRTIEIIGNESLNDELKNYVLNREGLLFPHPYDKTRRARRAYAYTILTEVDDDIWPHWLRSQRACQLADELGFDLEDRQNWFKWKDQKYAKIYGSKKYELRDKWRNPKRRI